MRTHCARTAAVGSLCAGPALLEDGLGGCPLLEEHLVTQPAFFYLLELLQDALPEERPSFLTEPAGGCQFGGVCGDGAVVRLPGRGQEIEEAVACRRVHRLYVHAAAKAIDVKRHPLLPAFCHVPSFRLIVLGSMLFV